ncbi:unnamed protein product [Allacma fusca]|uniref:Uncharacterized protein n=1 Tax=Allacma fusca TaxID=39272 RepID=A0A8J2KNS6_9HEXA|nr:unnamed protein product [Allacma fusca]
MSSDLEIPTIVLSKEQLLDLPLFKYLQHPAIMDIFKPMTIDDLLELALDLESWKAPEHFQKMCSYKFIGYDQKNRPIWVCKLGDYTVKDVINRGEVELFERYFWQAILAVVKSIVAKSTEENPSQQAVCIVDADDVSNYRKFMHGPSE